MHVLATAGHVDHGKSTLLRALTGMEPDRWEAERRRGMTLDLGFVWTTLPTGTTVAFVDVPGHERFVPTTLAGIGPVPAVLFVVAADEGWMPQSQEHLDALDALNVRHGLLAVTRSDLRDPQAARTQALEHLATSSLGQIPSVCVSATTGTGLPELRTALSELVTDLPTPDLSAEIRLWVDRVFTIRGAGTVVTATLSAGTLHVGDELQAGPGGRRVRIRGLQSLGQPAESVPAVARVALNLRGVPREALRRGDALLTPGVWLATSTLDVRLSRPPVAELPRQVMLHTGTAAVATRLRPLGEDTARLTLAHELPLRIGDRALLRDPSTHRIPTGITVLDVAPPPLRRRGAAAARATELATMTATPDGAAELRRRGIIRRNELIAMGAPEPPGTPQAAGWLLDPTLLAQRATELAKAVTIHATTNPLDPGLPLETARRLTEMPDIRLVELLLTPPMTLTHGRVHPTKPATTLPDTIRRAITEIRAELAQRPFAAPEANRLAELGLGPKQLAAAVRAGELLKIADGIYLAPGADNEAITRLRTLPTPFTLSQARQALDTTRRVALPLMELLARRGITRQLPDGTHEFRSAAQG